MRAGKLINEWSRPIFNLATNFSAMSKEEREQRDFEQLNKAKRISNDGGSTPARRESTSESEDTPRRPGDPGWVYRARVPQPSTKAYVVRPKWKSDIDISKVLTSMYYIQGITGFSLTSVTFEGTIFNLEV